MSYFGLWVLFAIFSSILASLKGRSALGWFFIGFFTGPFGLLVTAFPKMEDVEKNIELKQIKKREITEFFKNNTHFIHIPNDNYDFYKLKVMVKNEYKDKDNLETEIDSSTVFKMKNKMTKSYIQLSKSGNQYRIEAYLMDKPTILDKKEISPVNESTNTNVNISDELLKLVELKEKGILTEDEFNQQKSKILNS